MAITLAEEIKRAHPDRVSGLEPLLLDGTIDGVSNVPGLRNDNFEHVGEFNAPISLGEATLVRTPVGHPDRPAILSGLGIALRLWYLRLGRLGELKMSIEHLEEALTGAPTDYPGRPVMLNNLGNLFANLYDRFGCLEDLEGSAHSRQQAV